MSNGTGSVDPDQTISDVWLTAKAESCTRLVGEVTRTSVTKGYRSASKRR